MATNFLAECYMKRGIDPATRELGEEVAAIARELAVDVRFVQVISIPEDEICFYLFEAPSADDVRLVAEGAGLHPERILETRR
ncbi:MAG: nickel-binding protein [Actinomycetota bacterium]